MTDLLFPGGVLITGIEQDEEEPEFDRVYIGPRYHWTFVLVDHDTVHMNPMGHTTTRLPPDVPMYQDAERCPPAYLRGADQPEGK